MWAFGGVASFGGADTAEMLLADLFQLISNSSGLTGCPSAPACLESLRARAASEAQGLRWSNAGSLPAGQFSPGRQVPSPSPC